MLSFLAELAAFNLTVFTVLLALSQIAVYAIGNRLGQRRAANPDNRAEGVKLIGAGILALTAFALALTLSMATARLQERREQALAEANAIGTAWLQAGVTASPEGGRIAKALGEYTVLRRDSLLLDLNDPRIDGIADQVNVLQTEIWADVTALVAARPDAVTASLMNAVNAVFDATTAERLAVNAALPPQLVLLLLALIMAGNCVIGLQVGMTRRFHPVLAVVLIALWTYVVVLILDFGSARLGAFRTSTLPYEMALAGFAPPG